MLLDLGSGAQSLFAEMFKPSLAGAACGGASELWVPAPSWADALCRKSYPLPKRLRVLWIREEPRQTFSRIPALDTSLPGDAGGAWVPVPGWMTILNF